VRHEKRRRNQAALRADRGIPHGADAPSLRRQRSGVTGQGRDFGGVASNGAVATSDQCWDARTAGGITSGGGTSASKRRGRKSNVSNDPKLSEDLERLVEPVTRGDPESPLRWTSKSVRKLAKELQRLGHQVSHELVSERFAWAGLQPASSAQDARGWRASRSRWAVRASQCASRRVPDCRGTSRVGGRQKERTGGRL
jgi:hypothetical protein